jgi:hypothetical protein
VTKRKVKLKVEKLKEQLTIQDDAGLIVLNALRNGSESVYFTTKVKGNIACISIHAPLACNKFSVGGRKNINYYRIAEHFMNTNLKNRLCTGLK